MSNKDLVLRRGARSAIVTGAATRWASAACSASASSRTTRPTTSAGILLSAVDGLLFGCGDAVIGVNPAADSVETVAAILRGLDRLIDALGVPTQACCLAHITHAARRPSTAARRSTCCSSRSPARRRPTPASASRLAMLRRGPRARARAPPRARRALGRRPGDVLRDGPGQRPLGRGASRRRPAHARGPGLRRGPGVRPVPGQQRGRLHRPGVPRRRAADHPGRAGGPLHGQAARPADGRATSATPTTPTPTRTRPTTCCCCWPRPGATTSWASRAPTT